MCLVLWGVGEKDLVWHVYVCVVCDGTGEEARERGREGESVRCVCVLFSPLWSTLSTRTTGQGNAPRHGVLGHWERERKRREECEMVGLDRG